MALAFMRRHKKWLTIFLWMTIPAMIVAFVALYIPTEDARAGNPGGVLAEVGGQPITLGEFQRAYRQQRQRLEQMSPGGRLDPEMLERFGLRENTLQTLVEEKLVALEAQRLGLSVDDDALAHEIATAPSFQENGRFMGSAELRRRLELAGISEQEFQEQMRAQMLGQRLLSVVTDGVAVSPMEVEREFRRRNEQVKVEYVLAEAPADGSVPAPTDAEVSARFSAKPDAYRFPERRVVSYVLVDPAALQSRVTVTEADLATYHREHKSEFVTPEETCASHILVKVKDSPEAQEGHADDEARALAQAALDQVKGGADFATVAKKASEDKGSAENGGDVGCFARGRMQPEFDNSAFTVPVGQTSDLVKTRLGYHVIRVNSRTAEQDQPLSLVKEGIRARLLAQRTQAQAMSQARLMSEALARGRSLEDAAKQPGLALTVQKSAPLARGAAEPPLDSPALVARAFELKVGETAKDAFDTSAGRAYIALSEVQPARAPSLAEVQDKVKADITRERAAEAARQRAGELRARAEKEGLDKAATALGLVRKETPTPVGRGQELGELGAGQALEQAAYDLPVGALSEPLRVRNGYAVLRVLEKKAFDPAAFAKEKDALAASLRQTRRQQLFRAYMSQARARFPVERRADLESVVG
jgi:peptidyl-prolyl cis-trans isomerase D